MFPQLRFLGNIAFYLPNPERPTPDYSNDSLGSNTRGSQENFMIKVFNRFSNTRQKTMQQENFIKDVKIESMTIDFGSPD